MSTKKKATPDYSKDPPAVIDGQRFYGMRLDEEQVKFANAIWNPDNDIVFVNSKAGTGKSTIAVGVADMLVQYRFFNEIVYIASPYGERKQGYLPGDQFSKNSAYADPLYQALVTCGINPNTSVNTDGLVGSKTGYITFITDTFLRGTNINDAVVILDEAENYTIPQMQKTLTRIGNHTKVIVIGHTLQCDLDNPMSSGFASFIELFQGMERCEICSLTTNHRSWISAHADTIQEFLESKKTLSVSCDEIIERMNKFNPGVYTGYRGEEGPEII